MTRKKEKIIYPGNSFCVTENIAKIISEVANEQEPINIVGFFDGEPIYSLNGYTK